MYMHMHTGATAHKHAHIHTKHYLKIYSFRRMVKESSLSKSISLAKISHSSPLSLIHPLFLCHFIQIFPELVLVHGRLMSCWGLWQSATSFYPFTSSFGGLHSALPIFSVWESVCGMYVSVFSLFMCLCVESWSRCLSENAVTTAPNPPLRWYLPPPPPPPPNPPYLFLCVLPLQCLVHSFPTSFYFTLRKEHRKRVRRLPGSHLWALTLPQKHTRAQTHSLHMHSVSLHCLICIWAQVDH